MKFKKILILLSIGMLLLIIFNVANTINNNASTKQSVKDDNNNNQSYANDYIVTDGQPINGHNNYTLSFKQIAGFKNYSVNYANYAESTAKITITDLNSKDTIYYSHTGKEIHIPCNNAKAGHYDVRIDSQNPHLNLDGYLSIKEY